MKKIKYLLLLILLLPFNVFAIVDNTYKFYLNYPTNVATDISSSSSVYFGANTTLKDLLDDLATIDTTNRKMLIVFNYGSGSFNKIVISALPLNSLPYVNYYETLSGTSYKMNQYVYNDLTTYSYTITSSSSGGSILDSNYYQSLKDCFTLNTCSTTKPSETDFTLTTNITSNKNITSTTFSTSDYSDTSDFTTNMRSLVYFSDYSISLEEKTGTTNYNRNVVIENTTNVNVGDLFPTYTDFYNISFRQTEPEPEPEPDSDVGFWKSHVYWFVDNDSEYGVLVNIYILFFITIIGTSFIVFVKMIRKNRW